MTSNKEVRAARKSYDLSTSAKWATLSSGEHNVQIVAKASGYRDSEKSAAVTVNKPAATFTLEAGTYNFKDGFDWDNFPYQPLLFKSNGIDYIKLKRNYESGSTLAATLRYYKDDSNFDTVCNFTKSGNIVWLNNAYKTITLSTAQQVSAEFYKWAITDGNLVKQVEPTGETWVINEIPSIDSFLFNVSFTSNNLSFNRFYSQPVPSGYELLYDNTVAYGFIPPTESFSWIDQPYRTVTFNEPPTGDLLIWLQANGFKLKNTLTYNSIQDMINQLNNSPSTLLEPADVLEITNSSNRFYVASVESAWNVYSYTTDNAVIQDISNNGYIQAGYYKISLLP